MRTTKRAGTTMTTLALLAALVVPSGASAATVYAASSLRDAFQRIDSNNTFSFLGSNTLQLQIERGAPADVFASASPAEPAALHSENLCTTPRWFATNKLIVITPKGNPSKLKSVYGLRSGNRRLSIGNAGVPIGDYTRQMFKTLHITSALTHNIVSQEPDVASIVSKVALGSADAGIVYTTDARIARGRVQTLAIPAAGQPSIRYYICQVTRSGADVAGANRFIAKVFSKRGRSLLAGSGFGVPPKKKHS